MIAIVSVVALAGLLVLAFPLYNDFRVDRLRQELFELRDELFDDAVNGRIAFDSPAYRATRAMLNGMIRFGHRISLSGVTLTLCLSRSRDRGNSGAAQMIARAFSGATPEARALCEQYMARAHLATLRHIGTSPFMYLLVAPALLTAAGVWSTGRMLQRLQRQFSALDASAYAEGVAAS